MIRTIVILALSLIASLAVNLLQFRSATRADAVAPVQAKLDTATDHVEKSDGIAGQRVTDDAELQEATAGAASDSVQTITRYVDRVEYLPAPACAPGADRVAAWNTIIGEIPQ